MTTSRPDFTGMMGSGGNYPKMALLFRVVIYFFFPDRCAKCRVIFPEKTVLVDACNFGSYILSWVRPPVNIPCFCSLDANKFAEISLFSPRFCWCFPQFSILLFYTLFCLLKT